MKTTAIVTALIALGSMTTMRVEAHGDVVPQAVDVSTLKPVGSDWLKENPYRGDKEAIRIGSSAYNQNCARCHGLEAVSGGIAPDLRHLPVDAETDDYFINTVRRGRVRNGAVYMPPFEQALSQEAIWAIRSYIETRHTDDD
ncbi:cytochrome c-550 PedF [Methyloversatilis discipulorum]|uniref:cytochrome c-550 PedF n=1 Tax=Methyloversatilis discipulorum TaxID=1119528 RepID=UPI0026EA9E8A|nr:cytochrome c-550 PedF [Methyloversatilis discipulorum]